MLEQYPTPDKDGVIRARKILDYKILPDQVWSPYRSMMAGFEGLITMLQVSTKAPWWKLEAWRRLDPRVRWCDILMRMELGDRPTHNAVNTECFRWRAKFSMVSWHETPAPGAAKVKASVLRKLTPAQRAMNSTRGSTPGLIDLSLGEQGGRVPLPNPPCPVRRSGVPTQTIATSANGDIADRNNDSTSPVTRTPWGDHLGLEHPSEPGVQNSLPVMIL